MKPSKFDLMRAGRRRNEKRLQREHADELRLEAIEAGYDVDSQFEAVLSGARRELAAMQAPPSIGFGRRAPMRWWQRIFRRRGRALTT
jgi:hypothetical protein